MNKPTHICFDTLDDPEGELRVVVPRHLVKLVKKVEKGVISSSIIYLVYIMEDSTDGGNGKYTMYDVTRTEHERLEKVLCGYFREEEFGVNTIMGQEKTENKPNPFFGIENRGIVSTKE